MSLWRRHYRAVQEIITRRLANDDPPTTQEIQSEIFGRNFDPDSRTQRDAIYQCICRGRENALDQWELYIGSPDYMKDLSEVEYYKADEIEEQTKSEDYSKFYVDLHMDHFGEKTKIIKENLEAFALIATTWKNKLQEYSASGNNLIIASYGPTSAWVIPSWWRWAIRETALYLRSVSILEMQFKRGISTKLLTSSGVPLEKAIGYAGSIRGVLEDGAMWKCPNCGMNNSGQANYCSNCGSQKPTGFLPPPPNNNETV